MRDQDDYHARSIESFIPPERPFVSEQGRPGHLECGLVNLISPESENISFLANLSPENIRRKSREEQLCVSVGAHLGSMAS
jgi:hypothetical protein